MEYSLETKIRFSLVLGRWKEEEVLTMKELGFSQEQLKDYTKSEIEGELQGMYEDWQANYLDSGWSVVEQCHISMI